jgi:hypothetical protein
MISFWLLLIALVSPLHDFHTSWMNITFMEDKKEFEITWRTDTEHLESVLSNFSGSEVRLDEDSVETQYLNIGEYISSHLNLTLNNTQTDISVQIVEVNFAETIVHFEPLPFRKKLKSLTIQNTMLVHRFPNQKNMHQLNYCGEKSSLLLSQKKTIGSILTAR